MQLHYRVPSMSQVRRELQAVVEAHSASNGIEDARALRDVFVCLVKEVRDEGYTAEHLEMLVTLAADLEATKGN